MSVTPPHVPSPHPVPVPAASTRSAWVLGAVAVVALVGWIANAVGGLGFPQNAPVEWVVNAGISLDLIAVVLATGIGCVLSIRAPAVRQARVFPWLGLGFGVIALLAWATTAEGLFATLFADGRGRYANDVGAVFLLGVPWTLTAVFSAYGYRRPPRPGHNVAAIAGLVLWAVVLVGVVTSSLIYAADLTD